MVHRTARNKSATTNRSQNWNYEGEGEGEGEGKIEASGPFGRMRLSAHWFFPAYS